MKENRITTLTGLPAALALTALVALPGASSLQGAEYRLSLLPTHEPHCRSFDRPESEPGSRCAGRDSGAPLNGFLAPLRDSNIVVAAQNAGARGKVAGRPRAMGEDMTLVLPLDTNAQGVTVGAAHAGPGRIHAFRWTLAQGFLNLVPGALRSHASHVNEAGQVIGRFHPADEGYRAFLWTPERGLVDIGTLGGESSCPVAINDDGAVVGWADTGNGASQAFLFTEKDGIRDLGTLGGQDSHAMAIHESGAVVGWAELASQERRAFVWTPATGMVALETPEGMQSIAVAMDAGGAITGFCFTDAGQRQDCVWLPSASDHSLAQGR